MVYNALYAQAGPFRYVPPPNLPPELREIELVRISEASRKEGVVPGIRRRRSPAGSVGLSDSGIPPTQPPVHKYRPHGVRDVQNRPSVHGIALYGARTPRPGVSCPRASFSAAATPQSLSGVLTTLGTDIGLKQA